MSKLIDLLAKNKYKTSQVDTRGVDKTPIEAEKYPFPNSKNLSKKDLTKERYGALGSNQYVPASVVPGYQPGKKYTDVVKTR